MAKNGRGERARDWAAVDNNDDLSESEVSQLRSGDFEGMDIGSIGSSEGGGGDAGNSDVIIVTTEQAEQVGGSNSEVLQTRRSARLRQREVSHLTVE
jgi:hypothetical protein